MEFEVGSILEGKVTGITKFGAFVALPGGKSGLVHISEIAYSYVNDVSEFLSEGQAVKVKIIGIDANNRINLSIKQTLPPPPRPERRSAPQARPVRPAGMTAPVRPAPAACSAVRRCLPPSPSPRARPALKISSSSSWPLRTASSPSSI